MVIRSSSGFTLIEILVVLAIMGMLTGIALPRLNSVYASVELSAQRRAIKDQIEGLGYLAYASGKSIVLESSDLAGEQAKDYPMQIPVGWQIKLPKSLRYSSRGICAGGTLALVAPDGSAEEFRLSAPFCRIEEPTGSIR